MNKEKTLWKYSFTEGVGNESAVCPYCEASYDWYQASRWFRYCPSCGKSMIKDNKATNTSGIYKPITKKQQYLINKIEDVLNVKFTGKSLKDASVFIGKHIKKFQEADALNHVDRWQADNGNF